MTRGRKKGEFKAGTLGQWLNHAKPGDIFWIERRQQRSVAGDAARYGKRVTTRTYYALHPDSRDVAILVRVRMEE